MVSKLFLERAENELELAKIIFKMSIETDIQKNIFHIDSKFSFYSAVITHSYYSIFYTAKSYLNSKNVKTKPPNEHKKTLNAFKKFVLNGTLDYELLTIYENEVIKANTLLHFFKEERKNEAILLIKNYLRLTNNQQRKV